MTRIICMGAILIGLTLALGSDNRAPEPIKAFCIDFNWGEGGVNGFARPGLWADADPAEHVRWYKALGANVIQTFAVSCNGYAWYKHGIVPEQPGLKADFLKEMVALGHRNGMKVMGYFCIGSNTRWGQEHPDLSYGVPSQPHIPYTDDYLRYLDGAIREAIKITAIDGFMIDWVWQPEKRGQGGQWLDCEKRLYETLMKARFPGETVLTAGQYNLYSQKALLRCWRTIRNAAKETDPGCIIWLSCNDLESPQISNSPMLKEVDWLMNERGDLESIQKTRRQTGEHPRLITCLAAWNKMDPNDVVPLALQERIGLYGFVKPGVNSLLPPVEEYLAKPLSHFTGDSKNIAALARTFRGMSLKAYLKGNGELVTAP